MRSIAGSARAPGSAKRWPVGRCAFIAVALFASTGCQTLAPRPASDFAYWSAPHDVRVTLSDSTKVELKDALILRDSVIGMTHPFGHGLKTLLNGKRYSVGLNRVIRIESHETTALGHVLEGAALVIGCIGKATGC